MRTAIEAELDELTAPKCASAEIYHAILEQFAARNMASSLSQQRDELKDSIGDTAIGGIRVAQTDDKMKRKGCPTLGENKGFT